MPLYCSVRCRGEAELGEHGRTECGGSCWAAVLPTEAVLAARVVARNREEETAALDVDAADLAAHAAALGKAEAALNDALPGVMSRLLDDVVAAAEEEEKVIADVHRRREEES